MNYKHSDSGLRSAYSLNKAIEKFYTTIIFTLLTLSARNLKILLQHHGLYREQSQLPLFMIINIVHVEQHQFRAI
jgi:hypothetical protein